MHQQNAAPTNSKNVVRLELGDAVTSEIRQMILTGEVLPGDRLIETELAERFGTSRGPVRDALTSLERTGLVTTRERRGSFVTSFTAGDVDEVYSLRSALEDLALEQAAHSISASDLDQLRTAMSDIESAIDADEPGPAGEADMRFHRTIVNLADNRRLIEAWEQLGDQTLLMLRYLSLTKPEIQGSEGGHAAVIEAVVSGEVTQAREALQLHLEEARCVIREAFQVRE